MLLTHLTYIKKSSKIELSAYMNFYSEVVGKKENADDNTDVCHKPSTGRHDR